MVSHFDMATGAWLDGEADTAPPGAGPAEPRPALRLQPLQCPPPAQFRPFPPALAGLPLADVLAD